MLGLIVVKFDHFTITWKLILKAPIRIFAVSELGVYIPEPNEIVYEK